jgi:hypothetical protein
VYIVRLNHDFWFEIGKEEGELGPDEEPMLNEEGFAYYVSFHGIKPDGSFWPDSISYRTISDAKAEAENRSPSRIDWQ